MVKDVNLHVLIYINMETKPTGNAIPNAWPPTITRNTVEENAVQ